MDVETFETSPLLTFPLTIMELLISPFSDLTVLPIISTYLSFSILDLTNMNPLPKINFLL